MPKRRRTQEESVPPPNFRRRMNRTVRSQEIIDDVLTWVPDGVVQEVYEHLLIALNDLDTNPPGGLSLAMGVGLFLIYLHQGGSFRKYEQQYGISDSSMNRLIAWMAPKVRFNFSIIIIFDLQDLHSANVVHVKMDF